ncbi:succinate dehydrogenase assembly factor 2 [Algirhabdus cladophorae]|uniref:succinate dehydrogenase assembly factor 2 n=1 Tax=Algirhabdus cladophorae TaxID=3377108 RepID=UPI003B84A778
MVELREHRIKRLAMRSMRRGIKEMDIILGRFSDEKLAQLDDQALDLYDDLLSENDHDLYQWCSGQTATPDKYLDLITDISENMAASDRK